MMKNTSPAMQALREKIKQYRAKNPLQFPATKPQPPERDFGYFNAWNCPVGRLRNRVSGDLVFSEIKPLPF